VKRTVVLGPRAELDIERACRWYDARQTGLGDRLLRETRQAMLSLEENADRFPLYHRRFRRILLLRFPYKIFYLSDGDRVLVFRVLHAKRDHPSALRGI
jgi:plasmid stabilization system protein ParE